MLHPEAAIWVGELRALQADFDRLRVLARETEADGHLGLLASGVFSCRARECQGRAVRLFSHLAHVLRSVEETRNLRSQLFKTSEQLAALFAGGAPATRLGWEAFPATRQRGPTAKDLLYGGDGVSPFYRGVTLHDRVLSVADAAASALHGWRPPVPPL